MRKQRKTSHIVDRFYGNWNITNQGCWEWSMSLDPQGYGKIRHHKTMLGTHRLSWMLFNGPIPEGICVCHKCDNRKCVNPKHLFLGTKKDNFDDMMQKGRGYHPSGMKNGNARFNEYQVKIMKYLYSVCGWYQKNIAKLFSTGQSTIQAILTKR